MKVKRSFACFLLTVLAIPIVISQGFDMQKNGKPAQGKTSQNTWGAVSEGFQLSAEMEKVVFQLGTPIPLKLTVKNASRRTLKLPVSLPEIDYKVIIKDEKGGIIPLTQYGEASRNPRDISRNHLLDMKPGEQISEQLSIAKIFNITRSGHYSVSVRRRILRQSDKVPAEVESNPVQFSVSN